MDKCIYCDKIINNKGSLKSHELCCKMNPNKIKHNRSEHSGRKKNKDYFVWNRGIKTNHTPWNKNKKGIKGTPHTEQFKKSLSEKMKKQYQEGRESSCGRSKKYEYESKIAGKIKLDGTWELLIAKYLDFLNVSWSRNKKRFIYTNLKGTTSSYQPDFYVSEWNCYLEVKGYQTDLDLCKWHQFPETLIILRKNEINIIKNLWEDSQVAYDTGLLTRHSRNAIESSNLSLPAIYINGKTFDIDKQ